MEATAKLPTLGEHNRKRILHPDRMAGVLCPCCGAEMVHADSRAILTIPPKYLVKCPACGHTGYKRG